MTKDTKLSQYKWVVDYSGYSLYFLGELVKTKRGRAKVKGRVARLEKTRKYRHELRQIVESMIQE